MQYLKHIFNDNFKKNLETNWDTLLGSTAAISVNVLVEFIHWATSESDYMLRPDGKWKNFMDHKKDDLTTEQLYAIYDKQHAPKDAPKTYPNPAADSIGSDKKTVKKPTPKKVKASL